MLVLNQASHALAALASKSSVITTSSSIDSTAGQQASQTILLPNMSSIPNQGANMMRAIAPKAAPAMSCGSVKIPTQVSTKL